MQIILREPYPPDTINKKACGFTRRQIPQADSTPLMLQSYE